MVALKSFLLRYYPLISAFLVFLATGRIRIYAQTGTSSGGSSGSSGDVDINVDVHDSGGWWTAWWVWVVGIAIFLIIIVAIVSAGRR